MLSRAIEHFSVLGRKDFEVAHFEHGKRESCVSDCSSYGDDPYCAGGKTYNNKCLMYNAVCTDGIAPGSKGACGMDELTHFSRLEITDIREIAYNSNYEI